MTNISSTSKAKVFIFVGRSGSGKGTQVELLKEKLGLKPEETLSVVTGDLFRSYIQGSSYTAKLAQKMYQSGGKDYDFLAVHLIVGFFDEYFSGKENLFFDGNPRSQIEAVLLDNMLSFYGCLDPETYEKPTVIYVDVSTEWALDKLSKRGRSDDSDQEKIHKKMQWFDQEVLKAIDFLKNNPTYHFVHANGEQTIEEVHQEILSKL